MNEQIESLPVLPMTAGRPPSIAAIDAALASEDKELLIITQRDSSIESPTVSDLYTIGTKAVVKRMMRRQDGAVNLIVQGVERVVLIKIEQTEPYLVARVRLAPIPEETNTELEAMRRA